MMSSEQLDFLIFFNFFIRLSLSISIFLFLTLFPYLTLYISSRFLGQLSRKFRGRREDENGHSAIFPNQKNGAFRSTCCSYYSFNYLVLFSIVSVAFILSSYFIPYLLCLLLFMSALSFTCIFC